MQPRKQHLVDTALLLFNQKGYHATGIDLILKESKVSKATLYKHFNSKDELIIAALKQRHEQVLMMLNTKMNQDERTGASSVLVMFDALNEWFNSDSFYGCNFINATAEYSDSTHPIHQISAQHKQSIVALIQSKLPRKDNDKAVKIGLLIEGSIVMAHTQGVKNSALIAKEIAQLIIK